MTSILQIAALSLVIWCAGRVALLAAGRVQDAGFLAVGAGAMLVFLMSAGLRIAGLYTFWAVVASLCILTAAGLARRAVRTELARSLISWQSAAYFLSVAALLVLFRPSTYFGLGQSAVYLAQGFDLFIEKDATVWPYFGELYAMPYAYVTHVLGAAFALLSWGDHEAYYRYGMYAVSVILAPLAPLGALLFAKRNLPTCHAFFIAALFVIIAERWRIISIRGESLGWILGFGFLLALTEWTKRERNDRDSVLLIIVTALLFGGVALVHGVVAMAFSFLGAGLLIGHFSRSMLRRMPVAALVGISTLLIAGTIYWAGFLHGYTPSIDPGPIAGTPDAAVRIQGELFGEKLDANSVLQVAPLASRWTLAEMLLTFPPAAVVMKALPYLSMEAFPEQAIEATRQLGLVCRILFPLGFAASALLIIQQRNHRLMPMYCALASLYIGVCLFGLYLNDVSVARYPLAAVRRAFSYSGFAYWGCVGLALASLLPVPLSVAKRSSQITSVVFVVVAVMWSAWSVSPDHSLRGMLRQGMGAETDASELYDAMRYVQEHTQPGEWVYSNIISDNQFWYLTNGRLSLTEGSAMYQIYGLQNRAANRLAEFRTFAQTADMPLIKPYSVGIIMLYKPKHCETPSCNLYGYSVIPTSFSAFQQKGYAVAYENSKFAILRLPQ